MVGGYILLPYRRLLPHKECARASTEHRLFHRPGVPPAEQWRSGGTQRCPQNLPETQPSAGWVPARYSGPLGAPEQTVRRPHGIDKTRPIGRHPRGARREAP